MTFTRSILVALGCICITVAWLIPNHYPPWMSFYNESASAIGLALIALSLGRHWLHGRVSVAAGLLAAISAIPIAQWMAGRLGLLGDVVVSATFLIGFAIAVGAGQLWASNSPRGAATQLAIATVVGSVISAMLAVVQAVNPFSLGIYSLDAFAGMRSYANLGQPNNLATLIGMGFVGLLVLYESRTAGSHLSLLMAFVLLLGITLTQSRTALVFGPLLLVCLLAAKGRGVPFRTAPTVVVLGTLMHWALTAGWPTLQKAMLLPAGESLDQRGIESVRFQMWPMLLDAAVKSPWTGYGWLQVGEAELAVADRYPPVGELWLQGHNFFIDLIVWCGYPLGFILSGLVIYWFASRIKAMNNLESVAGMMAVTVFGTHAMLELPHHYAYFLIPVGLWIGQIENARTASPSISARWLLAPALLSAVVLVGIWKDYPAVEEDFRLVRFENFRIGHLRSPVAAPDAPLLTGLTEFLRFSRILPHAGMSAAELARMDTVVRRTPHSGVLLRYAIALSLNGRLPEARVLMVKARHIHGEASYANLRRDLLHRVAAGQSSLGPLLAVMP